MFLDSFTLKSHIGKTGNTPMSGTTVGFRVSIFRETALPEAIWRLIAAGRIAVGVSNA